MRKKAGALVTYAGWLIGIGVAWWQQNFWLFLAIAAASLVLGVIVQTLLKKEPEQLDIGVVRLVRRDGRDLGYAEYRPQSSTVYVDNDLGRIQ